MQSSDTSSRTLNRQCVFRLLARAVILFLMSATTGPVSAQEGIAAHPGDRPAGWIQQTRSAVMARNGMVATSQPLAVEAGLRILQKGGNAVDAAVAVAATLNVVEPMMTGVGGDMFAIVYLAKTGELIGLNGSGRAPKRASVDVYRAKGFKTMPQTGIFSVTVPGTVDGWDQLLKRAGTMTFKEVLQPAIQYAEEGFPVSEVIQSNWAAYVPKLKDDPDSARTWLQDGQAPQLGSIFKNPSLAKTFRLLAEQGRDAFYKGEIARAIVAKSQALGGLLTLEDLASHTSTWVTPIHTNYRGYEVYELPPNPQGVAALQMLNILEGYDLRALGPHSPRFWHLLIEAKKLAYADLAEHLADPEFSRVPTRTMLSKEYAAKQRARIVENQAASEVKSGIAEGGDTVYLTVVDRWGNMVSFIQSLYSLFGSGITAGDTGIMLQNRGALFVLDEKHPNRIEAGKRPYHTIIPAFVMKDGRPWLSFGVMGGDEQAQAHVQVLVNLIDLGMNVQAAGEAARFHHLQSANTVAFESGVSPTVIRELTGMGHRIVSEVGSFGGYQAIMRDPVTGVYVAGSDPRKDGLALGY
ncbi:MAG: gamma-glutamyltransferase [Acidobacteriia bacterium]|nr:gamma-glutamyltransferase [Terriglobia bacterium]